MYSDALATDKIIHWPECGTDGISSDVLISDGLANTPILLNLDGTLISGYSLFRWVIQMFKCKVDVILSGRDILHRVGWLD